MTRSLIVAFALAGASVGFADMVVTMDVAPIPATGPATAPAVDFANTHCMVMSDDEVGKAVLEYNGKIYHFCCPDCLESFKKDPEKYIKAAEADPAKYGLKK